MNHHRVLTVLGTRPEAIKMAPVIKLLAADAELDHCLVVTAQHRELLDDVLALFQLEPQHDLNLMQQRQSLEYLAAAALEGLSRIIVQEHPSFVLVHGDTTTTFIAALAAFYQRVPVGPDGLLAFAAPGSTAYYSPELREITGTLTATAAVVFPRVQVIPGESNLFRPVFSRDGLSASFGGVPVATAGVRPLPSADSPGRRKPPEVVLPMGNRHGHRCPRWRNRRC